MIPPLQEPSDDGSNSNRSEPARPLAPVSIGLIAAQSTVAQPYADFDYFEITSL